MAASRARVIGSTSMAGAYLSSAAIRLRGALTNFTPARSESSGKQGNAKPASKGWGEIGASAWI